MSALRNFIVAVVIAPAFSCQSEATRVPDVNVVPPVPAPNEWRDPVTSQVWSAAMVSVVWADASEACSGTFRLPLPAELRQARVRGICEGRPSCGLVWSSVLNWSEAMNFNMQTGETGVAKKDTLAQAFCVEN